jgi:hypothetical protein
MKLPLTRTAEATMTTVVKIVVLCFLLLILGVALYQLTQPEPQPRRASPEEIEQLKRELHQAEVREAEADRALRDFEKKHGIPHTDPGDDGKPSPSNSGSQ